MDKKKLSEADICLKFITPALVASGWDADAQVFQEFTLKAGRMVVRGQHAARDKASIRRADYMLCRRADQPLAVIEAKDKGSTPILRTLSLSPILGQRSAAAGVCAILNARQGKDQ